MLKKIGFCLLLLFGLVNCLTYTIDNVNDPLHIVNESFLSVALDISDISNANLSHPNFSVLVKHLSPMYFRIGGTLADTARFEDDTKNKNQQYDDIDESVLLGSHWLKIHEFTKKSNVRLLFDLNSLMFRHDDGSWNSTNAEEMIKFSEENGIDLDWELGNEPDLYKAIYGKYVNAAQLGNDYKNLRTILNNSKLYQNSYLVGPSMFDVGGSVDNQQYLKDFLSVASSSIHAVTWHQYYFAGKGATEDMFLNPATFNYLEQRLNVVKSIVGDEKKIWLGETSSAYNGGVEGMSDRFLASFLWLDKLGLGAQKCLDLIIRQTIWGKDNYPLLDIDYNPNPDWWVSVLYKKLVGNKVLSLTHDGNDTRTIRVYAHCAKSNDLWNDSTSTVVVFSLNLAKSMQIFTLDGLQADSKVFLYELTAGDLGSLYTKSVLFNEKPLNLDKNLNLPNLKPNLYYTGQNAYAMKAYSMAYWVFTNTNVKACQ